jgi:hypothetical protein
MIESSRLSPGKITWKTPTRSSQYGDVRSDAACSCSEDAADVAYPPGERTAPVEARWTPAHTFIEPFTMTFEESAAL